MSNFLKSSCLICKGFTQCLRCENCDLKAEVNSLRNQIRFLTDSKNELLEISRYDQMNIIKTLNVISKPIDIKLDDLSTLPYYYFITLTFDPNKFGVANDSEQEKQYLRSLIAITISREYISKVYGCFEYQKNGAVHCHFICYSYDSEQIVKAGKYYKKRLTNNPHNRCAVQIGKMKYPQAIEYINKESVDYFQQTTQDITNALDFIPDIKLLEISKELYPDYNI